MGKLSNCYCYGNKGFLTNLNPNVVLFVWRSFLLFSFFFPLFFFYRCLRGVQGALPFFSTCQSYPFLYVFTYPFLTLLFYSIGGVLLALSIKRNSLIFIFCFFYFFFLFSWLFLGYWPCIFKYFFRAIKVALEEKKEKRFDCKVWRRKA